MCRCYLQRRTKFYTHVNDRSIPSRPSPGPCWATTWGPWAGAYTSSCRRSSGHACASTDKNRQCQALFLCQEGGTDRDGGEGTRRGGGGGRSPPFLGKGMSALLPFLGERCRRAGRFAASRRRKKRKQIPSRLLLLDQPLPSPPHIYYVCMWAGRLHLCGVSGGDGGKRSSSTNATAAAAAAAAATVTAESPCHFGGRCVVVAIASGSRLPPLRAVGSPQQRRRGKVRGDIKRTNGR